MIEEYQVVGSNITMKVQVNDELRETEIEKLYRRYNELNEESRFSELTDEQLQILLDQQEEIKKYKLKEQEIIKGNK